MAALTFHHVLDHVLSWATIILLVAGSLFIFVAAIGILRMPDLFMRMQAATKAPALGASLMFLAALIYFWEPPVTARALAAILFIFLTLPLAAHILSRAAYLTGTRLGQNTRTWMPEPHEDGPDVGPGGATDDGEGR